MSDNEASSPEYANNLGPHEKHFKIKNQSQANYPQK